jgi:UDP-glucose:(heptosyl)LPS alpha-1,3-glucosyltransferase
MRLAFAIVSLFPGGGLQRDCLALAGMMRARGHEVTIFASRINGTIETQATLKLLANRAWTNHGRNRRFSRNLGFAVRGRFDLVVGFDKLAGLDVLYCADPAIAGRRSRLVTSIAPRYRALRALERACFARGEHTRLLLLSARQLSDYRAAWHTERSRLTLLPPNIDRHRRQPQLRSDGTREELRASLGIAPATALWLAVGVQPRTKGFDRVVTALRQFPAAHLIVAGLGEHDEAAQPLRKLAQRAGCAARLHLLGLREDIPALMAAADLLVHPARYETTGTAILEAVVNGLPVITTEACGFAGHVKAADAGIVLPEPFKPQRLAAALKQSNAEALARWSVNGARYGENPELYRGLERAADIILGQ